MALDEREILNIVSQELSNSAGGEDGGYIEGNRKEALSYYLGQPNGREVEGRSAIVSTDVADAIEWIMPEIVKAFTQNNEVVTFDATSSADEDQALLESRYVYDILMKENKGFIVLHQFIKDCLLQKNGFIKVFYEKITRETKRSYTGLVDIELQHVLADPKAEIFEKTEYELDGVTVYDVKILISEDVSKVTVVSVPPEEFRINNRHNSVDVSTARFTAHVLTRTAGELIADGFTKEDVDAISTSDDTDLSGYRFYMQDEAGVSEESNQSLDPSLRPIDIAECFMHLDMNEDGISEFYKITVAGGDNPTSILEVEEVDSNPFISSTAILMSHKVFGLSIYDRLKQIQDQKTSLWRNIFDNMYLQNNQRTVVVENQVNLDDLLVSRPGGIIRAKRIDAVQPYVTPPLPGDSYKMMDYLDQVRAGRSGASPDGPINDNMIGDRVGSEGVQSLMSQKEELVGLMIRVICETGVQPLCYKIREEAIKHQDAIKEYKFKDRWVSVNPADWRNRANSTIRVGTGSGNRKEQQGAISQIMMIQEKMMANPNQAMVNESKLFRAIDDFAKFSGMPGAESYFLDPESEKGKAERAKADEKAAKAQQQSAQAEAKEAEFKNKIADAETSKAETAMANVRLKGQVEMAKQELSSYKLEADSQIAMLKQQLDETEALIKSDEKVDELEFKYYEVDERLRVERERIEASALAASQNNSNKESSDE